MTSEMWANIGLQFQIHDTEAKSIENHKPSQ